MLEMKLKIAHRIMILNLLPAEGNAVTLRIVRELQTALSFTEKEIKEKFLRQAGGRFLWGNPEKKGSDAKDVDGPVPVCIGKKAREIIKDELVKVDGANKLRAELLPLYDHFVEGKKWDAN